MQFSLAKHQSPTGTLTLFFRLITIGSFLLPLFLPPPILPSLLHNKVQCSGKPDTCYIITSACSWVVIGFRYTWLILCSLLNLPDVSSPPLTGLSSSLSNPSIQASLNNCQLQSSLSNPSINSSLRLSNSSPRRRPAPISPLTLSPGSDQRRGLAKQLSPTMSPLLSPITQVHTRCTWSREVVKSV